MRLIQVVVLITTALQCKGVSYSEQLDHIARRRLESLGLLEMTQNKLPVLNTRRFNPSFGEMSVILGGPSRASHLPEAEAILPAHTLIKPAIGMLKSAIKFPHKDPDDGGGVYGNLENIGIKYDGRNERVMYSGFRRMPSNYIMVAPIQSNLNDELRSQRQYGYEEYPPQLYKKYKLYKKQLLDVKRKKRKNRPPHIRPKKGFLTNIKAVIEFHWKPKKKKPKHLFSRPKKGSVNGKRKENVKIPVGHKKKKKDLISRPERVIQKNRLYNIHKRQFNTNLPRQMYSDDYGENKQNNVETTMKKINMSMIEPKENVYHRQRSLDSSSSEVNHNNLEKLFMKDKLYLLRPDNSTAKEKEKYNWFSQSKNTFNHIKIDLNAPDHSQLMPDNLGTKLRNWWFYHQDDYEPFKNGD